MTGPPPAPEPPPHPDPSPTPARSAAPSHAAPVASPGRSRWVDLSVGLAAVVVSAASLLVARHQARVMDRQLAASVWPMLQVQSSNVGPDDTPVISPAIENAGVGPTRIRSFAMTYEGKPVRSVREILDACCTRDTLPRPLSIITSSASGRVLGAGDRITVFRFVRTDNATELWQAFDRARPRLDGRLCYCSVLDDCWMLTSEHDDPQPVRDCAAERELAQFRG